MRRHASGLLHIMLAKARALYSLPAAGMTIGFTFAQISRAPRFKGDKAVPVKRCANVARWDDSAVIDVDLRLIVISFAYASGQCCVIFPKRSLFDVVMRPPDKASTSGSQSTPIRQLSPWRIANVSSTRIVASSWSGDVNMIQFQSPLPPVSVRTIITVTVVADGVSRVGSANLSV